MKNLKKERAYLRLTKDEKLMLEFLARKYSVTKSEIIVSLISKEYMKEV